METRFDKSSHEYRAWYGMVQRCTNPKNPNYKYYGERGIAICPEWIASFETFLKDMGKKPTVIHSLDRTNNDKGYSPENCKWATKKEQSNNRRNNVKVTYNDQTLTISQWADVFGLTRDVLYARYQRGHFPFGSKKRVIN